MLNRIIITMCGIPGAGKSTISRLLHELHGIAVVSSDDLRNRYPLAATYYPETGGCLDDIFYGEIRSRLEVGTPVIVDATYHTAEKRKPLIDLGRDFGYEVIWCHCTAGKEAVLRRLRDQKRSGAKQFHSSIPELVAMYLETSVPPGPDGGEGSVIVIDSEKLDPRGAVESMRTIGGLLDEKPIAGAFSG